MLLNFCMLFVQLVLPYLAVEMFTHATKISQLLRFVSDNTVYLRENATSLQIYGNLQHVYKRNDISFDTMAEREKQFSAHKIELLSLFFSFLLTHSISTGLVQNKSLNTYLHICNNVNNCAALG